MKKYEGNEIIRKIIDSNFTCKGINRTSECPDCPFIKKCPDTSRETRQKVLEFILYEILEHGFDFRGNWNEAQATKILIYYTSDTKLWKMIGELYDQKYDKKWTERLNKLNVKEDLNGYQKGICSKCGKECFATFAPRNPEAFESDGIAVSVCCKAKINYEQPTKKDSPGYYVFNRQGQSPRYVHDTYKSALEEAIRLSKKHHNNSFVVCQIKAEIKQEIKTFVEEY